MYVSAAELNQVLGDFSARALLDKYGGARVYVPERPYTGHELEKLLGMHALAALCGEYGGMKIDLPRDAPVQVKKKNIIALLQQDESLCKIAMTLGVTRRYVQVVKASMRPQKTRQLKLF